MGRRKAKIYSWLLPNFISVKALHLSKIWSGILNNWLLLKYISVKAVQLLKILSGIVDNWLLVKYIHFKAVQLSKIRSGIVDNWLLLKSFSVSQHATGCICRISFILLFSSILLAFIFLSSKKRFDWSSCLSPFSRSSLDSENHKKA